MARFRNLNAAETTISRPQLGARIAAVHGSADLPHGSWETGEDPTRPRGDRTIGHFIHVAGGRPVGGGPSSAVGRAKDASTPPRSSRWAVKMPMCRTHPPRLRRPLGCDPLPNKGWCRNSGKNEIGCGNRCRRRARRSSGRRQDAPALWDMSHRSEKPCRCDVGTPYSGIGKPDPVHPW